MLFVNVIFYLMYFYMANISVTSFLELTFSYI